MLLLWMAIDHAAAIDSNRSCCCDLQRWRSACEVLGMVRQPALRQEETHGPNNAGLDIMPVYSGMEWQNQAPIDLVKMQHEPRNAYRTQGCACCSTEAAAMLCHDGKHAAACRKP